jgi:hypothetical protein
VIEGLFSLAGAAAGAVQARLLARAARNGPGPFGFAARLLLVGAVLVAAARAGALAPAAATWFAGFATTGLVLHRRLR